MLIGIDISPCSLSLRNRSTLCSTTKCHQNKTDLKNVFVQKFFFQYLLFFQSQSCLLESVAAIFRQSAEYVCWSFDMRFFCTTNFSSDRFFDIPEDFKWVNHQRTLSLLRALKLTSLTVCDSLKVYN